MTDGFRPGVRLAIDVGDVRTGVAACDSAGIQAHGVATVLRTEADGGLMRIEQECRERQVMEVIVGLPRSLSGGEGPAAAHVRQFAALVAARLAPVPVRLVDERLTTVAAHQALHSSGRKMKRHRPVVDQVAAALILETALDLERSTGRPPGDLVSVPEDRDG